MIDVGSGALPVYFDHNGDGLLDLLVSVHERYDTTSGNYKGSISYYENTGTATEPEFTFVTNDYQNFSQDVNIVSIYPYPAFGDLDGDGDEDMIIRSNSSNFLTYYENVAGPGNPASFSGFSLLPDTTASFISQSGVYAPKFVDLNRDGRLDIVLGLQNGKLAYYENIGNNLEFSFALVTDNLGGVDVSLYFSNLGVAVPEFVDIDTTYNLVIGSASGYVHYYDNIDGNLTGLFNQVDSTLDDIYIGTFSAPAIADLDGDNKLEMVLGNKRGGLGLYESVAVTDVGIIDYIIDFAVYPNPAKQAFHIDLSKSNIANVQNLTYRLLDITGRQVLEGNIKSDITMVDCHHLSKGIYLLNLKSSEQQTTKQVVLE